MENNNGGKFSGFYSKKLRAGKRRTYFFDVRSTKQGDFFLTITESKKRFEGDGYDSHKIFLYKEDFKKFVEALDETVNYIKTELMPEYDYDAERLAPTQSDQQHEDTGGAHFDEAPQEEERPQSEPEQPKTNDDDLSWN